MISNLGEYFVELICEPIPFSAQQVPLFEPISKVLSRYEKIDLQKLEWGISPNRIFFAIKNLPSNLKRNSETIKGPSTSSPYTFVERFLEKYRDYNTDLFKQNSGDKEFWFVKIEYPEEATHLILPEITLEILNSIKWPEYMKWGKDLSWIRPIRRLFAMFMDSPMLFKWNEAGIMSSPSSIITPTSSDEFMFDSYYKYLQYLESSNIFPDFNQRYKFVKSQADSICVSLGLSMKESSYKMIEEICRSTESPVLYSTSVDTYYDLPDVIVETAMMEHQKYVPLFESDGKLSKYFLIWSNLYLEDEGIIFAKDARICMDARLRDAKFFWAKDISLKEADYNRKLRNWNLPLGNLAQQSTRVEFLIEEFFPNQKGIKDASRYLNFDFCMNLIFEFPELHGKIAAIYASEFCGVNKSISNAIEWSVFPKGDMPIPAGMPLEALVLGFCVRLDKIVGSIGKGKIPKGSSDQLGIRRAASELTKIGMRLKPAIGLSKMISHVASLYEEQGIDLLKETTELSLAFIKERLQWELESILESEKVDSFVLKDVNWQELERARVFLSSSKESMQFLIAFYKRLSGVLESDFSKTSGNIEFTQDLSIDPRIKMQIFGQTEDEGQIGFKNASEYLDYLNILFKKTEAFLNELYVKDLSVESQDRMLEFLAKVKTAGDNYADFSSLRGISEG